MAGDWFTLRWADGVVEMLDQRLLPEREEVLRLETVEDVARAIEDLAVRDKNSAQNLGQTKTKTLTKTRDKIRDKNQGQNLGRTTRA